MSIANVSHYVLIGQDKSVDKLAHGEDLNLYECVSAYQMHIAMWSIGWVIAPEAAMEARLLHRRNNYPVLIYSSFPSLAKPEKWKNGIYNYKDPQFKYAVALNAKDLNIEKGIGYTKCTLTVEYTDNVHEISGFPINTCLFRYLQDIGWLHPYEICYIDIQDVSPNNFV